MKRASFAWLVFSGVACGDDPPPPPEACAVRGEVTSMVTAQMPTLQTAGAFTGDINGTFEFTLTNILGAMDPEIPSVMFYVGKTTIRTADGDLIGTDAGSFDTNPQGRGDFSELLTFTGGTGTSTRASGTIYISGAINPTTGVGKSDYQGHLCLPAR